MLLGNAVRPDQYFSVQLFCQEGHTLYFDSYGNIVGKIAHIYN